MGRGFTLGVGGHVSHALTKDKARGLNVPDSKVRAMSLGPSMRYDNGKGWIVTAKWQKEFSVRNSTEGAAFWVKSSIAF